MWTPIFSYRRQLSSPNLLHKKVSMLRSQMIHKAISLSSCVEGSPGIILYGSRWFTISNQAEKNRSVKNVLTEKKEHHANSNTHFP